MPSILCKCGCGGEIVPKKHHKWKPAEYISGHNAIGENNYRYNYGNDIINLKPFME